MDPLRQKGHQRTVKTLHEALSFSMDLAVKWMDGLHNCGFCPYSVTWAAKGPVNSFCGPWPFLSMLAGVDHPNPSKAHWIRHSQVTSLTVFLACHYNSRMATQGVSLILWVFGSRIHNQQLGLPLPSSEARFPGQRDSTGDFDYTGSPQNEPSNTKPILKY